MRILLEPVDSLIDGHAPPPLWGSDGQLPGEKVSDAVLQERAGLLTAHCCCPRRPYEFEDASSDLDTRPAFFVGIVGNAVPSEAEQLEDERRRSHSV